MTLTGQPATTMNASGRAVKYRAGMPCDSSLSGAILIAPHARPDFIQYFPFIAGAVFETGGIACHAAIMAREFGLPCLVGVSGVMSTVSDDDFVCINSQDGQLVINE